MKKTNYFIATLSSILLLSCSDEQAGSNTNNNDIDFKAILQEMKDDKDADEKTLKLIEEKIKNQKEKNKETSNETIDAENAIKINSYDFFEKIYSDRSVNLNDYLGKTIILTDVYVWDVFTKDTGDKFIKAAKAIPYSPKKNMTIGGLDDDIRINGKFPTQNELLFDQNVTYYTPIEIDFKSAEEMKKVGLLDWEGVDFSEGLMNKIDIIFVLSRDNIEFKNEDEIYNNMKAGNIQLSLDNVEILTKKSKTK